MFYRAILLRYAYDVLGQRRRFVAPQRYNVTSRCLYLSEKRSTCMKEIEAFAIPKDSFVIRSIHVELNGVLDLTSPKTLNTFDLSEQDLSFDFRAHTTPSPTQRLGEACAASGLIDGILFESIAAPGETNLVVLESNLASLGSDLQAGRKRLP